MKLLWILSILLLLAIPSLAHDEWTKIDTVRQLTFTVVECIDWLQTKEIARNPNYYETNPYLGKHPSQKKVDTYFASCLIGHALVSYLLPAKVEIYGYKMSPRATWQYFWIGVEAGYTAHNYNIGIRIPF